MGHRDGRARRSRRRTAGIVAAIYGILLLTVAFWPTPVDRPFESVIARVLGELHEHGMPAFIGYGFLEFSANVALFVPAGLIFALLLPVRRWPVMFLCGPVLSFAVELAQATLLPARYATSSDVLANSVGAALGVAIALAARFMAGRRRVRRGPEDDPGARPPTRPQ